MKKMVNDMDNSNYNLVESLTELINEAQQGDKKSMGMLTELAEARLQTYIFRLTLNQDITEELCQKTLVKMVQSLKTLEDITKFWNWLFRHAMGEVQHYYRDRKRRQEVEIEVLNREFFRQYIARNHHDGLEQAERIELSNIIHNAIAKLKLTYRNVLVLRCFEELSYAEIAQLMDCKELRARVLFFRARHALRRHLSRNGFSKETLLAGLSFFGILTFSGKTTSTVCSVKAASLDVGFVATLAGSLGTRLGITLITTSSALLACVTFREMIATIIVITVLLVIFSIAGLYYCLD
jgi:RNA polymerase sigma-70 factor (ECF subfamily)